MRDARDFLETIELRPLSHAVAYHKQEIERFRNDNDFISTAIKKIDSVKVGNPLNSLQRLFIKLLMFTPITIDELIALRYCDVIVVAETRSVFIKDKYYVFLPLIPECQMIDTDDMYLIFRDIVDRRKSYEDLKSNRFVLHQFKARVFRRHELDKLRGSAYVAQVFFYLLSLGLRDEAQAMTKIQCYGDIFPKLNIPII